MRKFYICIILFLVYLIVPAEAAKVYLKNGKVVEGKIVDKDDRYVYVETDGMEVPYRHQEISTILDDELEASKPKGAVIEVLDSQSWVDTIIKKATYPDMSEKKLRMIVNFMEVSGMTRSMQKNVQEVIDGAPEKSQVELRELLDVKEILQTLIPIYDKHFTEFELFELVRFYQTSAGKKVVEISPQLMEEAIDAALEYFKEKLAQ